MVGSLHQRASELFEGTEALRVTGRRLALLMVSTEGGRVARRRVSRRELESGDPEERDRVRRMVERLTQARLLVAD